MREYRHTESPRAVLVRTEDLILDQESMSWVPGENAETLIVDLDVVARGHQPNHLWPNQVPAESHRVLVAAASRENDMMPVNGRHGDIDAGVADSIVQAGASRRDRLRLTASTQRLSRLDRIGRAQSLRRMSGADRDFGLSTAHRRVCFVRYFGWYRCAVGYAILRRLRSGTALPYPMPIQTIRTVIGYVIRDMGGGIRHHRRSSRHLLCNDSRVA